MEPKHIVAGGYDEIWSRYEEWPEGDEARLRWLAKGLELVPQRSRALDLGCSTVEEDVQPITFHWVIARC